VLGVLDDATDDFVVGMPRSGLVPASMIALLHNKPLADLDGFIPGRILGCGQTRDHADWSSSASDYRRVLAVDDSINQGAAMQERLAEVGHEIEPIFLVVYSSEKSSHLPALPLEVCTKPRIFEWNMLPACTSEPPYSANRHQSAGTVPARDARLAGQAWDRIRAPRHARSTQR
jgi:hypothetical protein